MGKLSEDQNLINVSKILVYYIWMFMDSMKWLNDNKYSLIENKFLNNAILEVHLIYSRVLIEFLTSNTKRSSDRFADSFFYDKDTNYFPISCSFLTDYKTKISKQLAHLTLGMPSDFKIKTNQDYEIFQVAKILIPKLRNFILQVPNNRFDQEAKENALNLLIFPPEVNINISLNAST